MLLSEVFLGLGEENFQGLLRSISMGKLRSFQLFDRFKTRTHLPKLNSESLRLAVLIGPVYALGLFLGTHMFGLASEVLFRSICYGLIALAAVLGLPLLDGVLR